MLKMKLSNSDNKLLNLFIFLCAISFSITILLFTHLEEQQSDYINDSVLLRDSQIINSSTDSLATSKEVDLNIRHNSKIVHDEMNHDEEKKKEVSNESNSNIDKTSKDDTNNNDNDLKSNTKLINILKESGVEITPDIISKLPTWGDVVSQYGSKPKIIGLETCSNFRSIVPETDAYIGPSGIFNTGTNLFADLLLNYCELPKREVSAERKQKFGAAKRMESGMLWHVPWGKHNPISWRLHHHATIGGVGVEQSHVLPVVTIKDPYHWIGSMCRHPYAAHWPHTRKNCPNLLRRDQGQDKPNKVIVPYRQDKPGHYDSLVGLWNEWYGDYLAIKDFPRIIIRFEDILFHFEEVITQVCTCGGGKLKNHENGFVLQEKNAKAGHNNGSNGLVSAMLRYANVLKRTEHFTDGDLKYAKETLRKDILELFGYTVPDE